MSHASFALGLGAGTFVGNLFIHSILFRKPLKDALAIATIAGGLTMVFAALFL